MDEKLVNDSGAIMEERGNILSMTDFSRTLIFVPLIVLLLSFVGCASTLTKAAGEGDVEVVIRQLDSGMNINQRDIRGFTALHEAAWKGQSNVVRILLERGADFKIRSNEGLNPLQYAALRGHVDVVRLLLNAGADPGVGWRHKTLVELAQERGHTSVVHILKQAEKQRYEVAKEPFSKSPERQSTTEKVDEVIPQGKERPRPTATAPSLTKYSLPQYWAVIVGISGYEDSRVTSLRYAAADAQSLHDWLVSPEGGRFPLSHVKLLINEQATGRKIKEALFVWLKQAIEEDLVIIFFAGHGSPESPDSPENLFLLPYDVQYDNIAATGFPMWDIETAIKRFIQAKKVVVLADACHSGGVGQAFDVARRANRSIKVNPIGSGLQNLSRIGDGIAVISSSEDKQFSQESQDWGGGHGVFTYFLLEGLKGYADYNKDNRVTLGELIPYLSEQVRRATRNAQSPTIAGKFDPALTIGR